MLKRIVGETFGIGYSIGCRVPVLGTFLINNFDQDKLVEERIKEEGMGELRDRRALMRVVEAEPQRDQQTVQEERKRTGVFAAEIVEGSIGDLPTELQEPVQALVDVVLQHEVDKPDQIERD